MHAEIIAVGTEITSGAKLDTNSQWLSLELAESGTPVDFHTSVADDLAAMVAVLRTAVERCELVIVTGGLGPTLDDLTRQSIAELMGVELVLHEPSLAFIEELFAKRGYKMPERNRIQAMFPRGSEPLANPRGSAPGIWASVSRNGGGDLSQIAAMPGVPSEMKRMFQYEVLPRLPGSTNVIRRARINCFGVGESAADELLGDLTARGRDPDIGITVHEATITLRITAVAKSAAKCDEKVAAAQLAIRERMGDLVFGEEDDELEHVVVRMLVERGLTLATAESGTGGVLAHRLTEVPGFERCYLGGLVAPTPAAKRRLLGVNPATLETTGAASPETAREMAAGCRERFSCDFALAVTECPRFDPEDPSSAVPKANVAMAGDGVLEVREHTLLGDLALVKTRAAKIALNLLRLHLIREASTIAS